MKSGGHYTLYDISLTILNLLSICVSLGIKGVERFLTPQEKLKYEKEIGITSPFSFYPAAVDALKKYGIVYINAGTTPDFVKHTVVVELKRRINLDISYVGPSTEHDSNAVHVYKALRNTSNSKSKFLLDEEY